MSFPSEEATRFYKAMTSKDCLSPEENRKYFQGDGMSDYSKSLLSDSTQKYQGQTLLYCVLRDCQDAVYLRRLLSLDTQYYAIENDRDYEKVKSPAFWGFIGNKIYYNVQYAEEVEHLYDRGATILMQLVATKQAADWWFDGLLGLVSPKHPWAIKRQADRKKLIH